MSKLSQPVDNVKDLSDCFIEVKSQYNGEEPLDIKQQCFTICQNYLVGNWTHLTIDDIQVKRLTGGMSNQVYYCKILDSSANNQFKEVVIRLKGRYLYKTMELIHKDLNEEIVGILVSEKGLGPKVYGVFSNGQIQKYYHHKLFEENNLYQTEILDQLSAKLAQFHAMSSPINRNKKFIVDYLIECSQISEKYLSDKHKLFEEYNCNTLLKCDLKKELNWIIDNIHSFDSKIVFTHNDFRFGNLMVTDDQQIIICDFETSCYSYRGYDFASLFNIFEKLENDKVEFKDESIVLSFISGYVRESVKIFGKQYSDNVCNSVENILRETRLFSLVYSMVMIHFMVFNNEIMKMPISDKVFLTVADCELAKFMAKKKMLGDIELI